MRRRNHALRDEDSSTVLNGGNVIIDLDGLGFRHKGEVGVFNRIGFFFKILHPERNTRLFIIRAPRIFGMIWGMVKKILDQRTVDKINILSGDNVQPVIDAVGAANVPTFLGGTNTEVKNPAEFDLYPQWPTLEEFKGV